MNQAINLKMTSYEQHLIQKQVDTNNMNEDQAEHYLQYLLETIVIEQQANLTEVPPNQKQDYITDDTWKLIVERDEAHAQGKAEVEKELNKNIRKAANNDKQNQQLLKLAQGADKQERWDDGSRWTLGVDSQDDDCSRWTLRTDTCDDDCLVLARCIDAQYVDCSKMTLCIDVEDDECSKRTVMD